MPNKRIRINEFRCVGSGLCVADAPDLFDYDDEGLGFVRPGVELDEARLRDVIGICPANAIEVVEDPT